MESLIHFSLILCLILVVTIDSSGEAKYVYSHSSAYSGRSCSSQAPLVCNFRETSGDPVRGFVLFTPVYRFRRARFPLYRCRVLIQARVSGLSPGAHGFHVHTFGDEGSEDGTATGGHFNNPDDVPVAHGFPMNRVRHWGDFGNINADFDGIATYRRIDRLITLPSILGRGMVIHADRDQGGEIQPTGGSGSRVATCVIGYANPDIARL